MYIGHRTRDLKADVSNISPLLEFLSINSSDKTKFSCTTEVLNFFQASLRSVYAIA